MELIPMDVCVLCDQNTAVLSSDSLTPYVKYMNSTFFDKDKLALERFQEATVDKRFCTLCAHKIVVSHKFKDIYEEIYKNRTAIRKTRTACLLCESKSCDLIQTDNNPNEFDIKIKSFMDSTLYPRPYLQCAICFDCLFYLTIWFEMNRYVAEKINGNKLDQSPNKSPKRKPSNRKRTPIAKNDNTALKKDKENITPENNNRTMLRRSNSENASVTGTSPRKQKQKSTSVNSEGNQESHQKDSNDCDTDEGNKINQDKEETSNKFNLFLKQTLKHLKSMEANRYKTEWPQTIVEDKKMFNCIPYVLVMKDSIESTQKEIEKDVSETIPKRRFNLSLNSNNNESRPKKIKKGGIKSIPKKGVNLRLNSVAPIRKSTRLDKPMEIIELSDSENEIKKVNKNANKKIRIKPKIKIRMSSSFTLDCNSPSTYSCNICDQVFEANCEYKAHCLWHEKPEDIVINIARENLPEQIKAPQFISKQIPQNKKKNIVEPDSNNIDSIVEKYVAFSASDNLEDSDCSDSNEIEKIIGTLNTEEDKNTHETSKTENGEISQEIVDSSIISNHVDSNIDADEKQASNTDKNEHIESEIKESQINNNKENENAETVADDIDNNSENDSRINDQTPTTEKVVEDTIENEDVQTDQESTHSDNEEPENIDEQQPNDLENTQSDCEVNFVEERLAKIHGEETELETDNNLDDDQLEDQQLENGEEETQDSIQSVNSNASENDDIDHPTTDNKTTNNRGKILNSNDSGSETDMEKEENHTKIDTINDKNISKKRKRVVSMAITDDKSEESSNDAEIVTPKTKRVRFAMDYQSPTPENDDKASDDIVEEESNNVNNCEKVVQETEDNEVSS